jgi:hypothetical protein
MDPMGDWMVPPPESVQNNQRGYWTPGLTSHVSLATDLGTYGLPVGLSQSIT